MVRNSTIAFLDILGFKQLIQSEPLEALAKRYEQQLDTARRYAHSSSLHQMPLDEPRLFPQHAGGDPYCSLHVFSDSIIVIGNGDDETSCLKVLVFTWRIAQAFLAGGLPLRGGISFGEIFADSEKSLYLGSGLTAAHALEASQNWIGISIDQSVLDQFPNLAAAMSMNGSFLAHLFPKHAVPMKTGSRIWRWLPQRFQFANWAQRLQPTKLLHTVNWRAHLVVHSGTRSLFKANDHGSRLKITNTLAFAKKVVETGAYASDYTKIPLECRTFYVGPVVPPFHHGDEL